VPVCLFFSLLFLVLFRSHLFVLCPFSRSNLPRNFALNSTTDKLGLSMHSLLKPHLLPLLLLLIFLLRLV
jgi:hypothetical protein